MQPIRDAFRGIMLRDLRPVEDKEGVRIGEDVRIYKEKNGYTVRFLAGTPEPRRKQIRDRLEAHDIEYKEAADFRL